MRVWKALVNFWKSLGSVGKVLAITVILQFINSWLDVFAFISGIQTISIGLAVLIIVVVTIWLLMRNGKRKK